MRRKAFYRNNRRKLLDKLDNNTLAIFYSGKEVPQISDLDIFTPDSNYFYLTGLTEPDQTLVLYIDENGNTFERLFIPENDPTLEKWVGSKMTLEEAGKISGVSDVDYSSVKNDYLVDLISTVDPIIGIDKSQLSFNNDFDQYTFLKEENIIDLEPYLDELRLIKDKYEIKRIKKAIKLSKLGIEEILKEIKPGLKEYELAALFEYIIKKNGGDGLSFPTIVASGPNGTILHYTKNDREIQKNDLVLFDLGGRYKGYDADISRTYPSNGKLTPIQEKFYRVVLETQKELINHYKKGNSLKDIQNLTKELFVENLNKEGIPLPEGGIDNWYYHSIGHSLGINTHDSQNRDLILEDGMVITCEPGLYAKEYGIGIRIEDDILISGDNPIILTEGIPKEIEDITINTEE